MILSVRISNAPAAYLHCEDRLSIRLWTLGEQVADAAPPFARTSECAEQWISTKALSCTLVNHLATVVPLNGSSTKALFMSIGPVVVSASGTVRYTHLFARITEEE